ncbi:helix-turn-helix domain-containing protein [Candidatus Deferrimicrobium sp.]|uniref:helix-turn-helix domain-containing protein n=1 Tax=Candidatus Deferrimicrobium sp. TaxID=3060586 RepID=UPI002ECFF359
MEKAGAEHEGLLRAEDVARTINTSRQTVYLLAREKKLPSVRWGRSVRFHPKDVEAFIEAHHRGDAYPKNAA